MNEVIVKTLACIFKYKKWAYDGQKVNLFKPTNTLILSDFLKHPYSGSWCGFYHSARIIVPSDLIAMNSALYNIGEIVPINTYIGKSSIQKSKYGRLIYIDMSLSVFKPFEIGKNYKDDIAYAAEVF